MQEYGLGVIGMGWMGETHSRAFAQVSERFWSEGLKARLVACADADLSRAEQAKSRFGFESCSGEWREVIDNPGVEIVTIAAPNFMHLELVQAAVAAGKHVFCEKPVGRSAQETFQIAKAVALAGVNSAVGFNYRWVPLVQYAHNLVSSGALGELTHFRSRFFSMYGHNPLSQLSWRFDQAQAGFGTLGDLLSHVIDMALFMAGPIGSATSVGHTFVTERPMPVPGQGTHFSLGQPEDLHGPVTNEDYVAALVQFESGARGVLEGCRVIYGPKCEMAFDWHGTEGAVRWDFERMNELGVYRPRDKQKIGTEPDPHDGFTRIVSGPEHPHFHWFQPGGGISLGYDDLKTLEAFQFLQSISKGRQHNPGVAEAMRVAEVQDAMCRSWESGTWANVEVTSS